MANARRGEVDGVLDGKTHRLCLTLGALAELEQAFGDEDMLALAIRFEGGRISARDAMRIIAAGLRGAGADVTESDVARMRAEGGVAGYVDIVARLLAATFAGDEKAAKVERVSEAGSDGGAIGNRPFPGTT
ncbi:MAG: gene transfer agent family protein [Hyphomicrobiaceae bacterium]|nr:gene transfer agent family protein [Hyphomicrobiaceae bacterium]